MVVKAKKQKEQKRVLMMIRGTGGWWECLPAGVIYLSFVLIVLILLFLSKPPLLVFTTSNVQVSLKGSCSCTLTPYTYHFTIKYLTSFVILHLTCDFLLPIGSS